MLGRPLLALVLLLLAGALAAPVASAGPSSHPYFDDGGALTWYRSYDQATRAARAEGKLVFIEYGRRICGSCGKLCRTTLGSSSVRHRLGAVAVGLAAECDHPDPRVKSLFRRHLAGARMLPFCGFVTPDGQWVTGFAGYKDPGSFMGYLSRAEGAKPRQAPRMTVPESRPRIARRPTPTRPPAPIRAPELEVERGPMRAPASPPAPQAAPERRPVAPRAEPRTLARAPREAKPQPDTVRTGLTRRPLEPRAAPAPSLSGDPDAVALTPPTSLTPAAPVLPKPRVVILPPRKVDPSRYPVSRKPAEPQALGHRARDLAKKDRWGEVLQLCAKRPGHPDSTRLARQAHTWAGERLDEAVEAAGRADYEDALSSIEKVIQQMAGEPEYVDAARGLSAIKALLELRYLDPKGAVAPAVRRQAHEDLRGTRWAILFAA